MKRLLGCIQGLTWSSPRHDQVADPESCSKLKNPWISSLGTMTPISWHPEVAASQTPVTCARHQYLEIQWPMMLNHFVSVMGHVNVKWTVADLAFQVVASLLHSSCGLRESYQWQW